MVINTWILISLFINMTAPVLMNINIFRPGQFIDECQCNFMGAVGIVFKACFS